MKPTRKLLAIPMAALVVLSALTGCSSDESEQTGDKTKIVLWMFPTIQDNKENLKFWPAVEEDFNASHEDIELQVELLPWKDRDTKISTALASGTGPDLVLLGADQARQFYSTGGLKPSGAAIQDELDSFFPGPLEAFTFDGELYGVPIYQESYTTIYNKTLFENAGIKELPETWDEIMEDAPKLADTGVAILDYSGAPEQSLNVTFYPLLLQAGGSVYTADGKDLAFDSPAGVSALRFLVDLNTTGGLPPGAPTNESGVDGLPLGNGTAAMSVNGNAAMVQQMRAALPNDEIVVGLPMKDVKPAASGEAGALSITSSNKNEEAAFVVAAYLASPELGHALNVAAGTYPVRVDTPAPADDEETQTFMAALKYVQPGPIVSTARQMMSILSPHIQAALLGNVSPEQALQDAAVEGRALIADTQ